jgi:hypothetical protein
MSSLKWKPCPCALSAPAAFRRRSYRYFIADTQSELSVAAATPAY